MLHSFLTSGGRPQTTLTNLITNGNFANGTTGYTVPGGDATLSAASSVCSVTGNGVGASPSIGQQGTISVVTGKKYYMVATVKVTNASCTSIFYVLKNNGGANISNTSIIANNPTQNQIYRVGAVLTITGTGTYLVPTIRHSYADAATANGKVMEVQEVLVIDLPATFGEGLEPSAVQMQRWLDIFSSGWFNTTKAIPKRIY